MNDDYCDMCGQWWLVIYCHIRNAFLCIECARDECVGYVDHIKCYLIYPLDFED